MRIDLDAVDPIEWFADSDDDGHGDPLVTEFACALPSGFVSDGDDCDDLEPSVHPGAAEVCDGKDNDCDGEVDLDAVDMSTWFVDVDGDGEGAAATSTDAYQGRGAHAHTAFVELVIDGANWLSGGHRPDASEVLGFDPRLGQLGSLSPDLLAILEDIQRVRSNGNAVVVAQEQVAIRVEQHRDAIRYEGVVVRGRFVVNGQGLVAVGPDFVLEVLVDGPVVVAIRGAEGDADNLDTQVLKLVVEVAVPATLGGSTRGPGEREEPHHRGMVQQIGLGTVAAVSVDGVELRRRDDHWRLCSVKVTGEGGAPGRVGVADAVVVVVVAAEGEQIGVVVVTDHLGRCWAAGGEENQRDGSHGANLASVGLIRS